MTASIGISISNRERRHPRELLRSADVALFHAKELGRGRYVLFDETLDRYSVERLELEAELREAVDRDQLILEYQPEIDLATGRIVGVEALVRWDHPEHGLIPPGDFIGLAEETGEIVAIGKWVLGAACRQAAAWKTMLPSGTPFTMSINLSANEFMEAGLVWEVLRTLRETGLDATSLRMEITESVLLQDAPFIDEVFLDLKQLGIELAIDDFGTGYSSLSYLRKLPADVLKIDRAFVADVDTDPREAAVVQSVVAVAEAGYPGGEGLTVNVLAANVTSARTRAEWLKEQWERNLGINVELTIVEPSNFVENMLAGNWAVLSGSWTADYPDPQNWLPPFSTGGGLSVGNFNNGQFDALIDEADGELDEARRMALYQEAQRVLLDEVGFSPVFYSRRNVLVKPWVEGFVPSAMDSDSAGDGFFDRISISGRR